MNNLVSAHHRLESRTFLVPNFLLSIEHDFDVSFVADLALREKQIQQNYRPVIAVHKWFARRPGTLFRSLLLAEFVKGPLRDRFYESNSLKGTVVADPFMGGGTPLLEANRLGCDVLGFDINPMAWWIVQEEVEHIDLVTYRKAANEIRNALAKEVGEFYQTTCVVDGNPNAQVKYFLWVKIHLCRGCNKDFDLFPGYLLAEDVRHPRNVVVCASCGDLNEVTDLHKAGRCKDCKNVLVLEGRVRRGKCECPHCGVKCKVPDVAQGPYRHRLFAIEYYHPHCEKSHAGRFFKKPDQQDLDRVSRVEARWKGLRTRFVPDDEIPEGDETDRLHRWGCRHYSDLFNARQRVGLELLCRLINAQKNQRIHSALATNLSDLLRYQNMLCRYDTMALKSLDIFSVHGFPIGLIQAESNLLGAQGDSPGIMIGSGGWLNIVEKYYKAKAYCDSPFEIRHRGTTKISVPIEHEWIGSHRNGSRPPERRKVVLKCEDAANSNLRAGTLDAVFTDPPYFGNVQYAELMDFCYVWLRRLLGDKKIPFKKASTRSPNELTGNINMGRGTNHFTEGLSQVFSRMAKALKPGRPLAFTFHHNVIDAYYPVAVAILDAGLTCSATLPCPAEMGASIHINGTGSSIIDTVFVCRSTGSTPRRWITDSPQQVAELVRDDMARLVAGNVKLTQGDLRCIIAGHLIRLAVWFNRNSWDKSRLPAAKLEQVGRWIAGIGGTQAVTRHLEENFSQAASHQHHEACEATASYETEHVQVSF